MMTSRLQGDGITHALGPHHGKTLTSFQIFTVAAERLEEALRTACVLFREHDRAFIPGRAWPGGSRFFRAAFSDLTMSSGHPNWQAGNRGLNLAPVIGRPRETKRPCGFDVEGGYEISRRLIKRFGGCSGRRARRYRSSL